MQSKQSSSIKHHRLYMCLCVVCVMCIIVCMTIKYRLPRSLCYFKKIASSLYHKMPESNAKNLSKNKIIPNRGRWGNSGSNCLLTSTQKKISTTSPIDRVDATILVSY